jgi:hypothetical protein
VISGAPRTFAVLGALLSVAIAPDARPQSFAIRDQNPLLRGQYLPHAVAGPQESRFVQHLQLTLSNTANVETQGGESLQLDGEAAELRWLSAWQPTQRLRLRLTVPLVHYSGGLLDGAIDSWHDAFGLSGGPRAGMRQGELVYRYSSSAGSVQEYDSGTAFGDSALEAGFLVGQTDTSMLSAWVGVELPTGDPQRLTGNDAWDFAAWIEAAASPSQRFSLDGRVGVSRPGSGAPLPLEPSSWVAFGSLGASWSALSALDLRVQLDAHDGFLEDTELRFLDAALQMTFGAEYRLTGGWRLQLAITEDLRVDSSPDFGVHFAIRIGGK